MPGEGGQRSSSSSKTSITSLMPSETYGSLLGSLLKPAKTDNNDGELVRKSKRRKLNRDLKEDKEMEQKKGNLENDDDDAVDLHNGQSSTISNGPTFFDAVNIAENDLNYRIEEARRSDIINTNIVLETLGRVRTTHIQCRQLDGLKPIGSVFNLKLQKRLCSSLQNHKQLSNLTELQKYLAPPIFEHQDVLYSSRSNTNGGELRQLYCLHSLNHIFRTRDQVLKNNTRDSKAQPEASDTRDQGYTRPKVLIVLPNKNACLKVVEEIVNLARPDQQENKSRFEAAYVLQGNDSIDQTKPEDFKELFSGNDDDRFRVGLKFTKNSLKFFSQFYNSDIIIGSPLGLRQAIESGDKKNSKDADFLSSIEVVVLDWADALQMQNWAHVEFCFKHLNLVPENSHGCDFSRIRNWYLDGNAPYFRQNIIISQFLTPELNSLFYKTNTIFGKLKVSPFHHGVLDTHFNQTYLRIQSETPSSDLEIRFKCFMSMIVPTIMRIKESGGGLLILLPSYLEFFRVSNALQKLDIDFVALNEYSSVPEVSRSRSHFASGNAKVLLYSERAHHFRRYKIKGVKQIFMYRLPANPSFYQEAVAFLHQSVGEGKIMAEDAHLKAIFSVWDALSLERVVGTKRQRIMCHGKGDTFDFP